MDRVLCLLAAFTGLAGVWAQPTADFSVSDPQGCAPTVITFQDLSVGAVSWEWEFGVSTSTLQTPTVLYSSPGTYDVTLIVTDAQGARDTLTRSDYIQIAAFPAADFVVDKNTGCTFDAFTFTDQSSVSMGSLQSWQWDFGDGTSSSQQNPTHVYTSPGSYPVSLLVTSNLGCSDDKIEMGFITINAPDADFTGDNLLACGPPLDVNFTPATSSGTHQWTLGDGTASTLSAPAHTYTNFGSFSVEHIVVDGQGCSDTVRKEQYVNIGLNTLSTSADDSTLCEGDSIYFFTNAASNSTVTWDFGNGDSSTLLNPGYRYTAPGTYTVTTTIEDQGGCSAIRTLMIEVYEKPISNFTVMDTTVGCEVPFTVQFVNQSTGSPVQYYWNLGNGMTSNLPNPTVTYTSVDSFRVFLDVTSAGGCVHRRYFNNYIQIQEIRAGFVADETGGCVPLDVAFTDTTFSPFPLTDWEWDFGNGNGSSLQNPTHTYANTGVYDVQLIATNSKGCKDTVIVPDQVRVGNKPTADFEVDTNRACALAPVQFTNLSVGASHYIWFFGDGDTAMSTDPMHGFAALGFMDVALVASDRGCRDTVVMTDLVEILAPLPIIGLSEKRICTLPRDVAVQNLSVMADTWTWLIDNSIPYTAPNFTHTFTTPGTHLVSLSVGNNATGCVVNLVDTVQIVPLEVNFVPDTNRGCIPVRINFDDASTNATRWKWHFGTGDSSEVENPSYTFKDAGEYDVQLIAQNVLQCRDTFTYSHIAALDVEANFTVDQPSGCVPLAVNITDLSQGTGLITAWEWDLGDSTASTQQNPSHIYSDPGSFPLSLTVTDIDGCQDSISLEDQVFATQPVPDILITPPLNCELSPTTFVSLSTGVGLSYIWEFGDGDSSILANTPHTYLDTGFYTVSLHVTDVNGCDSSLTIPDGVEIRTLRAEFEVDTTFAACPPLNVHFSADTTYPHADISYFWDFGNGATSTQSHPTHNYTLPGIYTITLIVSTPTGCTDTLIMQDLIEIEGPTGEFTFGPTEGCPGLEVAFTAFSTDSVEYEWVYGDGNLGTGVQSTHVYTQPGQYIPVLVVEDTTGCRVFHISDSAVEVFAPPATAFSADQQVLCDQGLVQFTDETAVGTGIVSWLWTFGDGGSSTQQHPSHAYTQLGQYDVQLITEGAEGCRDTLFMPNFIEVLPSPEPAILATDTFGCVPFSGQLTSLTPGHPTPISFWDWNLDQGNTSSAENPPFTYTEGGQYEVRLTLTDAAGCQGDTSFTLTAWSLPEPAFVASDSFGCAPFSINLTHATPSPLISLSWDMGNGDTLSGNAPTYTYQQDGIFGISLTVTDTNGCQQTVAKEPYIHLSHPVADFTVFEDLICPGDPVSFTDASTSDTTLVSWVWNLGNGDMVTGGPTPVYVYDTSGTFTVSLLVEDVFGCVDSLSKPDFIEVREDIMPSPVAIRSVSVRGDKAVEIRYESYDNRDDNFGAYLIYRQRTNGSWQEVGRVEDLSTLTFLDAPSNTRKAPLCYRVQTENLCGTRHDLELSEAHCTVELLAQSGTEEVRLSWHPYVGWPGVDMYRILRVQDYDMATAELLATVSGTDTSYLDTAMFCYDTYTYRIEAVGGPGRISLSDTAFAAPRHLAPDQPNDILQVTIEDNDYVAIQWETAEVADPVALILERKALNAGGGFQEVFRQSFQNANKKYQDEDTRINQTAYTYRIFTEDTCGDRTPLGQAGNSLLLRVQQEGGSVLLEWNAYEGWGAGVARYEVEVFDEASGSYRKIGGTAANKTSFETTELLDQPLSCFRVWAYERDGRKMNSLSNEACLAPDPILHMPNAFTPNGDANNDRFELPGLFLSTTHFQVFNRWGKLIYESHNLEDGWDGTDQQGEPAPEGVYVYRVEGVGYSGKPLSKRGSIMLLR